jgi:hypothetical protein
MTNYIRSIQKLTTLIKEIFAVCEISLDTRAIVLLLSVTMPSDKFNLWIDQVIALRALSPKYKQIHSLKAELGPMCSQYVYLSVLNEVDHDLSSEELQRFISNGRSIPQEQYLQAALNAAELTHIDSLDSHVQTEDFVMAKNMASDLLMQKLSNSNEPHISIILDTYTHCRRHSSATVTYYAIVHAIAELLISSGIVAKHALSHSNKIVAHGLEQLIHDTEDDKLFTCLYDTYKS